MRFGVVAFAAVCAASVAGCAPAVNETNFAAGREALIGSPALYRQTVARCAAWMRQNPSILDNMALLTNQPKERTPDVSCDRIVKAIKEGRYTHQSYLEARKGNLSPELIRIVQGR